MFKFRKPSVSSELDVLNDSPPMGDPGQHADWGSARFAQGDSVSESRFSVLPKDDHSERCSVSMQSAGSEQEDRCTNGSLQQQQNLHGLSDVSGPFGKTLLDRKRKERHESTSSGQEKKVIRSASDDESRIESGRSGNFRRTLSHDSFSSRKEQNPFGYSAEMRQSITQDLVELAKHQSESDISDDSVTLRETLPTEKIYGGEEEPQFDVMRKITGSENYEPELQRQQERFANWSSVPPTVKKSHKRRHRSSRRDTTKEPLEIKAGVECADEEMLSPASGSSESAEEMVTEQSSVPNVEIDDAEDMTSQTSERLMALDVSNPQQQQQHQQKIEQKNLMSIRAALGGTSADSEVMLSPRNSVLGKEGIDIPPSPPLHAAPMDPPISRMGFLESNPVTKMNELSRLITALKRQLKSLESEYEQVYGYRPSHSDKLNHKEMRKCVLHLSKTKKELKQIREDPSCLHTTMSVLPGVSGNILSVNRGNFIPPTKGTPEYAKYLETTVKEIEKSLGDKRRASNRPDDLEKMNTIELQDEKCLMQRQLLVLEKRHGRPSSKAEKDIVRPLYERYRAIKRFSIKVVCVRDTGIDLAPIMEGEPLELGESAAGEPVQRAMVANEVWASGDRRQLHQIAEDEEMDERNESYNNMSLGELEVRLKQAKDEKRKMRSAIRKFETDFQNVAGRPPQKDEKYSTSEMELTYQKYKRTKATVRLLDVLIGKKKVPSLVPDGRKN